MKVLTFKQLAEKKGIPFCRMHIRRLIAAGKFPKPIPLGAKSIAWVESEIDDFLKERAAQRDAA